MLRGVFCHDIAYLKVHSGLLDDVNPDGAYCKQKEQPEITRYLVCGVIKESSPDASSAEMLQLFSSMDDRTKEIMLIQMRALAKRVH